MTGALSEQLSLLPDYLSKHLLLSVVALAIGIGISFPLSLLVTRVRPLQAPTLAIASAIQTVPSLALLALMVPLLRTIGFVPAVIALTLYSMLPVIRNTVTGIEKVDPNLIEAGRGLGMTENQLLVRVQIPLAMPMIIAGIRTATVWVVGIATLSTPVGATSLGNYIFSGLQTQNHTAVAVGCIAAAVLALALDGSIRLMEVAASRRSRAIALLATVVVAVVLIGGLSPMIVRAVWSGEPASGRDSSTGATRSSVVVGAKTFTEQYILAEMLKLQLESAGYRVQARHSLGSTIAFDALASGQLDVYVDYSGTIWANYMKQESSLGRTDVLQNVTRWLKQEHGITCLGSLGFENAYALAMPRALAEQHGIESIEDLVQSAPSMTIGGDYEFFGRPEWKSVQRAYGLHFKDLVSMDSALMYQAAHVGDVEVIAAFSTDGRIDAMDLIVLDDNRDIFPPYDAVLLVGADAAGDDHLMDALNALVGSVSDELMRVSNRRVDVDRMSVTKAAALLAETIEENDRTSATGSPPPP